MRRFQEDYNLYEGLSDRRREKTLGQGVFLNTIHGAKGLEFGHVFILDGDWHLPNAVEKREEERRIFIGYAGGFAELHPIHQKLAALSFGDPVTLAANGAHVDILSADDVRIARLSKEGARLWADRLQHIHAAKILGMVHWTKEDSDPLYRDRFKAGSWDTPLIEVVLKKF